MSGSFTGFSEDDIKNLNTIKIKESQKNGRDLDNLNMDKYGKINKPNKNYIISLRKAALTNNHIKKHLTPISHTTLEDTTLNSNTDPIPDSAKLCQNEKPAAVTVTDAITMTNTQEVQNEPLQNNKDIVEVVDVKPANNTINEVDNAVENNFTKLQERKLNLAQFQQRQKIIEDQNKKRKELLAKALAVRTQQTQEEAQKLDAIRNEYKKLDKLLSSDVRILRHQIELASVDYMEAEKRYYRIEREFLDAKLYLHQRLERKEMLTEHLCAVIEKNEERKAEKLNELLNKLNLKTDFVNAAAATSATTTSTKI